MLNILVNKSIYLSTYLLQVGDIFWLVIFSLVTLSLVLVVDISRHITSSDTWSIVGDIS